MVRDIALMKRNSFNAVRCSVRCASAVGRGVLFIWVGWVGFVLCAGAPLPATALSRDGPNQPANPPGVPSHREASGAMEAERGGAGSSAGVNVPDQPSSHCRRPGAQSAHPCRPRSAAGKVSHVAAAGSGGGRFSPYSHGRHDAKRRKLGGSIQWDFVGIAGCGGAGDGCVPGRLMRQPRP
jgi:hypothetical protein